MTGFHIDMNIAQFTRGYLEKWLKELARLGYDTVIWEVENNIRWETCPECASPDAFTKNEFREIIALCRGLGLEPIPLFQTIGHCEYVLKHRKYRDFAETPGRIDQYCPQNPDLPAFLSKWIDEYLEIFGPVKYFHLGADEAWSLGSCPKCGDYAARHSLSRLYIDHVNAVAAPLIRKGIKPIIWADMVLHHYEDIDKLARDIVLFDWMYDIRKGMGKVWVWGREWFTRETLPPEVLAEFGDFLFPEGDEPGREPEAFYHADYLAAKGFKVVKCPASSSYGDNVFAPRNWFHMANTFDSAQKGLEERLAGVALTSWTVHLFPWELQLACIDIPPYLAEHPRASMETYQDAFMRARFGISDKRFWRACGLLSKNCLFTHTASIGHNKSALPVPLDHVAKTIDKIKNEGRIAGEAENCRQRLAEYTEALSLFDALGRKVKEGQDILAVWKLASRNLINRAECSLALLHGAMGEKTDASEILAEMRRLRDETDKLYASIIKPARRGEMMGWIYASMESALARP